MDKETSAGHQIDAIEQPTEEIERDGTILVSHKPPTAYKTLNPTQNLAIRGKFELPRALIFIILLTITPRQGYGLNFSSKRTRSPQSSKNPQILTIPHFHSLWKMNWKSPLTVWTTNESKSRR